MNYSNLNMPIYRYDNGTLQRGVTVMRRDGDFVGITGHRKENKLDDDEVLKWLRLFADSELGSHKFENKYGLPRQYIIRARRNFLAGRLGVDEELAAKL